MPKYQVTLRRDAWIVYLATVEADTPEQAAQKAERAWKDDDPTVKFEQDSIMEFDEVVCDPDECEVVE